MRLTLTLLATAAAMALMVLAPGCFTQFTLKSYTNGNCIDVYGESHSNNAAVELYPCVNGAPNERFMWNMTASYGISFCTVAHSYKCIEVVGGSTSNGATITQQPCIAGGAKPEQWWGLVASTRRPNQGLVMVKNYATGKCITAETGYVDQWDCVDADHQLYTWGSDSYVRSYRYQGQCLEITSSSLDNGARLQLAPCNTNALNQRLGGSAVYGEKIIPMHTLTDSPQKCLDSLGNTAVGSNVVQNDCSSTVNNNQLWARFVQVDTQFSFSQIWRNLGNNLCLASNPNNAYDLMQVKCSKTDNNQLITMTFAP